jgi:hypothetical protein
MKDYTMQLRWLQKEKVIPPHGCSQNLVHEQRIKYTVLQQLVYINGMEQWEDVPTVCV